MGGKYRMDFGCQKPVAKNAANMVTLFALSNLWMARKALMTHQGARG